ncbi:hypothetical protein D3C78_1588530 [compost metagenome]
MLKRQEAFEHRGRVAESVEKVIRRHAQSFDDRQGLQQPAGLIHLYRTEGVSQLLGVSGQSSQGVLDITNGEVHQFRGHRSSFFSGGLIALGRLIIEALVFRGLVV